MNFKYVMLGILAVLVFFVGSLGLYCVGTYNGIIQSKQGVETKWSQVENQYQVRLDKLEKLEAIVKGSAFHEQSVIDSVTNARAALAGAKTPDEKGAADKQVAVAIKGLLGYQETYPEIKANQNFTDLMREASEMENKVGIARGNFNNSVLTYNNKVNTFPSNLIAGAFGFSPMESFKAEDGASKSQKMDFTELNGKKK